MKRRTILKGVGATGLIGASTLGSATARSRAGGLVRFADDRDPVVVDRSAVQHTAGGVVVSLDDGDSVFVNSDCTTCECCQGDPDCDGEDCFCDPDACHDLPFDPA